MTTPTSTEGRLRSMLIELAESTPIRTEPPVLPEALVEVTDELDDRRPIPTAPHEHEHEHIGVVGRVGPDVPGEPRGADGRGPLVGSGGIDEVAVLRARRSGGSRLAWALTAVAGVLLAVLLVSVLRARDTADPFAHDPADVPAVDLGALAGGRLAFVVENDLFVADAQAGVTRRITDVGRGNEVSNVSWSHDGEWIAFEVHDQNGFWIVRHDGSERHHVSTSSNTYAWSPTNEELVYADSEKVWVTQADGTSRALEGNFPPADYTNVVWSPDGTRVAFAGSAGNLAIGTLQGQPDAGWGSRVSPPVRTVLAWPRSDYMVVEQLEPQGSLLAFDPGTSATTPLATIAHWDGGPNEVGIDPVGARMVIITDAELWSCPLDRGVDAGCSALGVPGLGLSSPVFVPGSDDVSFISTEPMSGIVPRGASLVTISFAADATSREPVVIGRVASLRRGSIDLGTTSYGVVPEDQIPLGGGFLVRVDERSIDLMTASGSPPSRTVVAGDRFLPPADEYPGGSGLAYWHR